MKSLFLIAFLFSTALQAKTLTTEFTSPAGEKITVDVQLQAFEQSLAGVTQDAIDDDGHMSFCFHQLNFQVGMETITITEANGKKSSASAPLQAGMTFSENAQTCEAIPFLFEGLNKRSSILLNMKELIPLSIQPPAGYDQVVLATSFSGLGQFQALLDVNSTDGFLYFTDSTQVLERSNLEQVLTQGNGMTFDYAIVATKKDGSVATLKQGSAKLRLK